MQPKIFILFVLLCATVSCVKDTDFDQADQISVTPEYELDLVFFTIDSSQFVPAGDLGEAYKVSDTTDIRFLDDSFIQESLVRAEVFFRFTNSIPRDFTTQIEFLNDNDVVRYAFEIPVAGGSVSAPVITEHLEIIETADDVRELTRSSQVVVSVFVPGSPQDLEGTLNLQSKSTYFLEY